MHWCGREQNRFNLIENFKSRSAVSLAAGFSMVIIQIADNDIALF